MAFDFDLYEKLFAGERAGSPAPAPVVRKHTAEEDEPMVEGAAENDTVTEEAGQPDAIDEFEPQEGVADGI